MELKKRYGNFKYIIKFFGKNSKRPIVYNMFYGIISGLLPIASLHMTKYIMSIISNKINNKIDTLVVLITILILINIVLKLFAYINSLFENISSLVFLEQFETKVFKKMNNLKIKYYADPQFNDLCQKVYSGGNTNCAIIISEFFVLIQLNISIILYVYCLIGTNIRNFEKYLIIASGIIALLYRRYFFNKQEKITINSKERIVPLRRKLHIFKKIFFSPIAQDELRTYNAQKYYIDSINNTNNEIYMIEKQDKYKMHNYNRIGAVGVYILQRMVYILLLNDIFENRINYGDFVLIVGATEGIFASIIQLNMNFSTLWENLYFVNYLKDFFDLDEESVAHSNQNVLFNGIEKIEFINVSFKYPNTQEYVLKNISFKIQKGEKIGIIGVNGSGKTTILKIIMKLYDVEEGEVLINGVNINEINIQNYYNQLGVVFQDYCKYSLSIKEFIMLNNNESVENINSLNQIIKKLELDTFICNLPNGIDTLLTKEFSDESIDLSEGQWQKIVIARACYSDKSLLILDEATAFLDIISEKNLFELIHKEMNNKTIIFISHNLSSVKNCDNILLIDAGKIICQGKHQNLMEESDAYKNLFNSQARRYG